ncbi:hypothetical protein [Burkholderia glumae]|uniref:Uncharacterized protein n=1 Tax=Burkholderia glumae TaxID=337 RepID=A0AAP9Y5C1_BURGL|nr:hypothetical protein [Burkholderia glumae]AJY62577.1 hypothetical protein KS03_5755 [Burkholderia glumae LMG 2196 = ATCC 33617]KHJ61881.1 hypothetical protein NCPPB3923_16415 [Burkholderia glumae]MCQ0034002.1 hypothetical protein [Burkholderia glumae]MCQ0037484.1 hypothetical protein [Burkholderia glumae]NVE26401.1 hypothetical protein [Burkholderia glumae]
MREFQHGPFLYSANNQRSIAGRPCLDWEVHYDDRGQALCSMTLPADSTQSAVIEALADSVASFRRNAMRDGAVDVLQLVRQSDDVVLSGVPVRALPAGMSNCLMDDRFPTWAQVAGTTLRVPMDIAEFTEHVSQARAPKNAWIAGLLPDEVLTLDADEWRAPTSWEIRHVVGEGSFTGVTGAQAAALVGVVPQNFRKYTAREGASARQSISFAMWHALLHRLGVKALETEGA